ncbi:DUF2167 domain-containing protein [soil metagenome]
MKRAIFAVLVALTLFGTPPAIAEEPTASQKAWDAAIHAAKLGPIDIPLADQAVLHLKDEYAFIPQAESAALMRAWGNGVGDHFFGAVIPKSEKQYWIATIDQTADGYVKDDEARSWDADDLYESLESGTEAQNAEREKSGLPALDLAGWIEKPAYEPNAHKLVWSLRLVERGAKSGEPATVNYNTYALGRDGYFEIDFITNENVIESEKTYARTILAGLDYNTGKRYEDFVAATDHMAEYGLAALVGGIAAKKLGLLAVAGVFLAKFAKVILIALAVAGAGFAKFFRRRKPADN